MSELRSIPVSLLDPSPFEPRESLTPLEDKEILTPLVVRSKGERFEIIAGHRRLETLKREGRGEAPCRVLELDDEEAAVSLFRENQDREDLSDYERGIFFQRFMEEFKVSEREAADRLGVSDTTINQCVGIVRSREKVHGPPSSSDAAIYESIVTATKFKDVSSLPKANRAEALQAVVENRLSTEETKDMVAEIRTSRSIERAVNNVVNRREERKPQRHSDRKKGISRVKCRLCRAELRIQHLADGGHRILKDETE